MKRKVLLFVSALVILIIIVVVILPFAIDADRFRGTAEDKLSQALGRNVRIGRLKVSLLAGGVSADSVSIADDPAFNRSPFIKSDSISLGVELWPLISRRELRITSVDFRQPSVVLLQSPSGKWNFSTLGSKNQKPAGGGAPQDISIGSLKVSDGRISVGRVGGKLHNYDHVNLQATNLSYTSQFPFNFSLEAPGGGRVTLDGRAGPLDASDSARTPFEGDLRITNLDLAQTGFVSPDSGISGLIDYTGKIHSDGKFVHSEGAVKTQRLRVVKTGSAATQPVTFNYVSDYDLARQAGALRRGEVRTGKTAAQLAGTFDARGESAIVHMKITGQKMAMEDIVGLLPAVGVTLPAGASLQGGTANANLSLDGPVDRLVTTGNLDMDNVKLKGFSMAQKLAAAAALAGVNQSPDTTIQTMSSNLRIAPEGIRADKLNLIVPELGSVTGGGVIGADSSLDFRLVAKVNTSGGGVMGGLAQVAGLGGRGEKSIPFVVKGTTSKPVFVPDVGAVVKQTIGGSGQQKQLGGTGEQLGGLLGGLLGKKKQEQQPKRPTAPK